ncbi:MAG TPA: tetratricopeptide repeat protein [Kiritimatiellia bacterium]|nr:tetratricopeptide repeat protein [Kiritimatiellia bacterium]
MKTTDIPAGLYGLVLLLLTSGCGTLVFPLQQERNITPGPEHGAGNLPLAEALAQYSMGVIEGLAGSDEESLLRFERAIENDPENIALRMEIAVAYLHRQLYPKMDAMLDEVILRDPKLVRAYQLRALGFRLRGMHDEAVAALYKAIELEPTQELHYLEIASIISRKGNLEVAMSLLEQNLGKVGDRLPVFQAMGELYIRQAAEKLAANRRATLPKAPLEWMKSGAEEFPGNAYLLTLYGELLLHHQMIEEAIAVFEEIEKLNPTDLAIRQKLAMSLLAVGNHERAIELLEEIANSRPRNQRLWYYLAELYEQADNTNQALRAYQKAIDAQPTMAEAYLKKVFIQLNSSDTAGALETLSAAEKAIPGDLRMMEMLAYVYLTESDYTNAIAYFVKVESEMLENNKRPLLTNFYLNYAITRQMMDDIPSAVDLLKKGMEDRQDIVEVFIGVTYRDRGNKPRMKSAMMILESFQEQLPEDTGIYTLYAMIAFNAGEYAVAQSLLERAESFALDKEYEDELTAQFYFWMGAAAERNKNYDEAEEYFLTAIRMQPDHADAHNYLAYMHAERGVKLEMAYDHVGVALAIEPDNGAYIDTRGWIYYQLGKYEEALADIKEAARLIPDDPTILDHLGDIYLALGDEALAIEYWKKSYEIDSENKEVLEKLTSRGITLDEVDVEPAEGSSASDEPTN